jgi:hypothetical protein
VPVFIVVRVVGYFSAASSSLFIHDFLSCKHDVCIPIYSSLNTNDISIYPLNDKFVEVSRYVDCYHMQRAGLAL